jgi:uncharacterized protein
MKISTVIHPNTKQPRVEEDDAGTLQVYVREPALEDKANLAVIQALAQHFSVKKSQVILLLGARSRRKVFEIVTE